MAQLSLTRISLAGGAARMPPVPLDPVTAAEGQTSKTWIEAGMPLSGCSPGNGNGGMGGASGAADGGGSAESAVDAGPDPFAAAPKCTSGTMWNNGTNGSPLMQPGEACITCHGKGDGPKLAFGGTVYPTGHEPSQCNGADGSKGAQGAEVVVVDATGKSVTAAVNSAGNFFLKGSTLAPPLKVKVVFMGKERRMITPAPSGDCNSCHTQAGNTTVTGSLKAPGRIALP